MPADLLSEDTLWEEVLENGSFQGDLNAAYVVRRYREAVAERPLMRLIQDVHQRIGIYSNILEDIKRHEWPGPMPEPAPGTAGGVLITAAVERRQSDARNLRSKYEELGLVPKGHLPNPWFSETTDFVLKKLRRYGTLLLDLMATQAETIAAELKVSPNVTVTFEVELDLTPSLTVGIEREGRRESR